MENICVCNIFWIILLSCLKVVTAQDNNIKPSLTISPAIVTEGNSQTLTCKYSGSESVTEIKWETNSVTTGFFRESGGSCQVAFPPNATLYSYTCDISSKIFTLTIKNVRRTYRNDQWECGVRVPDVSTNRLESNIVKSEVKVLITSVSMTLPQTSTVTIQENTPQLFRCVTSGGLPEPTVKWYNESTGTGSDNEITSSIVTSYTNTTDGLVIATSSLTFTPTKYDNEISVYCSAYTADQTPITSTRKPKLNVLYGPDGAPVIQGYTDGASYSVIENTVGQLTCLISGGNPLPTLTWNCYSTGTSDNTDADTVSKTARWTAGRGQDRDCTCYSTHISRNGSVTIQVQILYPPTTPTFYIKSTQVSGTVKVIRNNPASITCSSSGKPNQMQYTWTPNTASTSGSVLNINSVQSDGQYRCDVQNSMDPSDGNAIQGRNSSSINIEALYPPSTPTFRYRNTSGQVIQTDSLNVIRGDTFKVACTSDGKPDPDFYQWDNRGNNPILTVSSITPAQTDHKYKCAVRNSMSETVPVGTNPTRGTATSTLTVHVMYPPSVPRLNYRYGQGSLSLMTDSFKKIEGDTETVTVICNSNSEPGPTFTWNGTLTSHSATLTLASISRSKAGTYTCSVENQMTRTFGNPEKVVPGRNYGSFDLQILYPPVVGDLKNESVAEGQSLTVTCQVTVGNPPETTFKWKNSSGMGEWRTQDLTIDAVSRNDAKFIYTCEVANVMQQTGKQQAVSKPDRKSFHLNVWYGAAITDFHVSGYAGKTSVTVNESGTVHFKCNVDSNPGSIMIIHNQTEGKDLASDTHSKSLEYIRDSATCFDAGFYACTGSNEYNTKISEKQLRLFVNCSPRQSPFIQLQDNVTSAQHKAVVMTFTALAYPAPTKNDFKWFSWYNAQWISLSDSIEYKIDTDGLQSNLTVKDVNRTLYGKYKLNVRNTIGDHEQIFHLLPEDKPEDPTDFEHVQKLVTETSFTVQWRPGFDNGPDQTFILKYRKASDKVWEIVEIPDTGKVHMNYTVGGLSSGTQYEVVIYASNELGNSSESDPLTIATTAEPTKTESHTAVIGGAIGGSVTFIVVVVAVIVFILRKTNFLKHKQSERKDGQILSEQNAYMDLQSRQSSAMAETAYEFVHNTNDDLPEGDPKLYTELNSVEDRKKEHIYNKIEKNAVPKDDSNVYVNLKI